jgi:hypothetical protein
MQISPAAQLALPVHGLPIETVPASVPASAPPKVQTPAVQVWPVPHCALVVHSATLLPPQAATVIAAINIPSCKDRFII